MKKILLSTLGIFILFTNVHAGGIVTNTNQSAAYVRMLARDATLGIDAVYFNPAGMPFLGTGLFLSLSNQTIFQNRTIDSNYPYLNSGSFKGKVSAPVFPSVYAAFNLSRLSLSFGFNPIGGGGSAAYKTGLPSFEYQLSDLVPGMQGAGVTGYKSDLYFKGQSIYWGAQLGAAYKINDMLSVFVGGRYVSVTNTYTGHINNTQLNLSGAWVRADDLMNSIKSQYNAVQTGSQALVDKGAGTLTYAQAEGMNYISALDQAKFEGALTNLGYLVSTNIATSNAIFGGAVSEFGVRATLLGDQEANVTQTGHGITPIIGADLKLPGNLVNIGIKYEFLTKIEVTNDTKKDINVGYDPVNQKYITQFPNGQKTPNDMPALLSVGASLNLPKITVSAGYHQYFDKQARYGKMDTNGQFINNSSLMTSNDNEIALGVEYNVNPLLLVSAGYLRANSGAKPEFQSDQNPDLGSNSGGIGGALKFTKLLTINVGVLYSKYDAADKSFTHYVAEQASAPVTVKETYGQDNLVFAVGVDINLSK